MASEERETRTEPATERKREEARKMGNFAQSHDLSATLGLMAGLLALGAMGAVLFNASLNQMRGWLGAVGDRGPINDTLTRLVPSAVMPVAWVVGGTAAIIAAASLGAGLLQSRFNFNTQGLSPKWERVSPTEGFKRIFSLTPVAGTVLNAFKLIVVGWAAYQVLTHAASSAPLWWQHPVENLLPLAADLTMQLAWSVAVPLLFLAAADYAFKKWRFERELMMTRDEVREEMRQMEGDPHIKQRIRQIQRQRAQQRMMQAVPKATVVLANPTHVAVALRYEPGMAAPLVVAKGEHRLAERIKAVAAENGVPVIESPPLARALLRAVAVGQAIPPEFYRAVAEILAVLYRRRTAPAW